MDSLPDPLEQSSSDLRAALQPAPPDPEPLMAATEASGTDKSAPKKEEAMEDANESGLRIHELTVELERCNQMCEDMRDNEEKANQELVQFQVKMKQYTPRPKHMMKDEPVKTIIQSVLSLSTAEQVARVEQELVAMFRALNETKEELEYYKACHSESRKEEFVWEEAFTRLADQEGEPRLFFLGFGDGKHIPKFLRSKESRIENQQLTKRETELMIKEIWRAKKEADDAAKKEEGGKRTDLKNFIYTYLAQTYKTPDAITAVAYNLLWGVKRYEYDADIELFMNVLMDEVDEDVYHDQVKLMDDFLFLLRALDERTNGRVLGAITLADFEGLLHEFFYSKTDEQVADMVEAAEEDLRVKAPEQFDQKVVAYEYLFEEDENFDQGPFAECVRDQHLAARTQFVEEVRRGLMAATGGTKPVSLSVAQEILLSVDPSMKPKLMYEYLARGFRVSMNTLHEKIGDEAKPLEIPLGTFVKHLRMGVILQKGRQDGGKGDKGGKGGKGGKGPVKRRNSFVLAVQALKQYKGEESDDDDMPAGAKKEGKKGKKGK